MPFLQEYQCAHGHRFDHLHMGSRETAPEWVECEGVVEVPMQCAGSCGPFPHSHDVPQRCGARADRVLSAPRVKTIVKGNADFLEREKERLTKRSQEYDNSHQGKQAKMDTIERRLKAGEVV